MRAIIATLLAVAVTVLGPSVQAKEKCGFLDQVTGKCKPSRKEKGIRRIGFEGFHRLFSYLTDYPIPSQTGIFGLLDSQVVEELKSFTEQNRFFPGLRNWVGFDQEIIDYHRQERAGGEPKQSLKRLIRYAFDAILFLK